jgi:tetratricopeptide (TPR) repeat protein
MTPKQEEGIRNKIAKIKKALAADKKYWRGYHDGGGLRYLPPELYIKLKDYKGAARYFNWFNKNFPDDAGYPVFLFEWTLTLFKNGKVKEARKKALETFFSNTYLFDHFLGKEFLLFDKYESSGLETAEWAQTIEYLKDDPELADFIGWLGQFLSSEEFYKRANEFIKILAKLQTEHDVDKRMELVERQSHLLDDFR